MFSLPACFGTVQVVPASAGPKLPAGAGWYCYDYATRGHTTSTCQRTGAACSKDADETRKTKQAGFCQQQPTAWCTAISTDHSDPIFACTKSPTQCGPVGGIAGAPGTKQTECAESS